MVHLFPPFIRALLFSCTLNNSTNEKYRFVSPHFHVSSSHLPHRTLRALFYCRFRLSVENLGVLLKKQLVYGYQPEGEVIHTWWLTSYIHHTSFSGAPRGAFQQPVYNKCKVRWLRVLARPLQAVHNVFFVWDIKMCPQLTVHNTGISLLLSTSVWVLSSPPIERRETRPTA